MAQVKKNNPWVRLHLANQASQTSMPPVVTGILHIEDLENYVLVSVMEEEEDSLAGDIFTKPSENMHFIKKTYVWNCEVLKNPPEFGRRKISEGYPDGLLGDDEGGLG